VIVSGSTIDALLAAACTTAPVAITNAGCSSPKTVATASVATVSRGLA
jgi:hypothetical protein